MRRLVVVEGGERQFARCLSHQLADHRIVENARVIEELVLRLPERRSQQGPARLFLQHGALARPPDDDAEEGYPSFLPRLCVGFSLLALASFGDQAHDISGPVVNANADKHGISSRAALLALV